MHVHKVAALAQPHGPQLVAGPQARGDAGGQVLCSSGAVVTALKGTSHASTEVGTVIAVAPQFGA